MPGRFRSVGVTLLLVALLATGCTITFGSGDVTTESRPVSGFDEIVLLGSGDVFIEVTGTESLEIEAEDNVMPLLTAEVVNGRLELGFERSVSTTRGITYTITATDLMAVTVQGSGDVKGSGLEADSFQVTIQGSGSVDLSGTSDDLVLEITGSGDFDGGDLKSAVGTVTVLGSGDALVNITDELTVTINGSGDVEYMGNPTLRQTINGSGDVARR